jgi:Flp pilus assembly protein TadB
MIALVAAIGIGLGTAAIAGMVRPPTRRLSPRVRPYAVVARTALGHGAEPPAPAAMLPGVFAPILRDTAGRVSRMIEARGDDALAQSIVQSGDRELTPEQYRVRQLGAACGFAGAGGLVAALVMHTPLMVLAGAAAGFLFGATRARRRLDKAIAARAGRIRLELYTINHLLAMHVRTGAGAMQAVQRVVDRGHGAVVDDFAAILGWTRAGMHEGDAFRHAAELSAEPSAARTYQLVAAGVERGVDLGKGLLALSEDIRDARREQLHKDAVRRRAAMLVPTIAVLAPIMLLFIAAPLPSIVLGHR